MVVPRIHAPYFEDLPADLAGEVVALGQRIAKVQKRLYGVERVGFMFTGGDVPHAHAHVVPMVEKTDVTSRQYIKERTLTFAPIPSPDSSELESVASEIRDMLRRF